MNAETYKITRIEFRGRYYTAISADEAAALRKAMREFQEQFPRVITLQNAQGNYQFSLYPIAWTDTDSIFDEFGF